jgi:uncharacterized membrane protein
MAASRKSKLSIWWWELSYRVGPNLWVTPVAMSLATLVLFAVTRRLDAAFVGDSRNLPDFLVTNTPADAALILTALVSAVGTALALVFSTSILTFSIASSQLGPRLIRRFMQDPITQATLGAFLSTLIFCVLTLASVRTGSVDGVPEVSVAVAELMSLGCFAVLVYYVHRVASTIQAPNVVAGVVGQLGDALDELDSYLPSVRRCADPGLIDRTLAEARSSSGAPIVAVTTGYVDLVDHPRLLDAAEHADAVLVLERRPGQFVVAGQTIARVVPAGTSPAVEHAVATSIEIGPARTLRQDLEFAVAQVVEIAMRALSPAINDTYTGLTCIDWLGAALVDMGRHPADTGGWSGDDDRLRLIVPPLRFERLLKAAFDQIRQAGADNPAVLIRMLDSLETMARLALPEHRAALAAHAGLIIETARSSGFVSGDLLDVDERYQRTLAALEG